MLHLGFKDDEQPLCLTGVSDHVTPKHGGEGNPPGERLSLRSLLSTQLGAWRDHRSAEMRPRFACLRPAEVIN